jgi:hypothetical protein
MFFGWFLRQRYAPTGRLCNIQGDIKKIFLNAGCLLDEYSVGNGQQIALLSLTLHPRRIFDVIRQINGKTTNRLKGYGKETDSGDTH